MQSQLSVPGSTLTGTALRAPSAHRPVKAPVRGNVADYLLEAKASECPALLFLDSHNSYGDLQAASYKVAEYLVSAGGSRGDRVVLIGDNSFFWVVSYLGILRAGMVCVPLPMQLAGNDLEYILRITDARFAFLRSRFWVRNAASFSQVVVITDRDLPDNTETTVLSLQNVWALASPEVALPRVEGNDLAALMFTSGSTGRPRGVMVSHANIIANTESIIQYLSLTAEDRIMAILPFHYCFGTSLLHTHLRVGGTLVVDSRFMYPQKVLERMQATRCTGFAGVPSHYQILLRRSSLAKMKFPHLRYVQQAGGHLAPTFLRDLSRALPGTQIFVMYGQTEATARLSYLPPELLPAKLGSIGKAIPGAKLSVVDTDGQAVKPGSTGEIVAEGENITLGYWRDPESSARTFRQGKLHTGDLATVDEDGFIYVVDRAGDFLKCGGKRVSCRQIEDEMLEFADVLEVAVIGIPDEVLGEAVKAFVVPRLNKPAEFQEQFRIFCKRHLASHLVPREIVVLETLPQNSSEKVLKQALRTM